MKRPVFQEKTEVKVVDKDYREYTCIKGVEKTVPMYGWRGTVKEIVGFDADWNFIEKPYSSENYPSNWEVIAEFKSPADGEKYTMSFRDWPKQLEPVQHKFVDIDYVREEDLVIGKKDDGTDAVRPKNTGCFEPGDIISISTKIDGANASVAWDATTGKLEIFSRTNLLGSPGALRGFYDYVKTEVEPRIDWSKYPDLVVFGEWCVSHSVKYDKGWYNKWRVYDVYDREKGRYLTQAFVKAFCEEYELEYVEELYHGPFVSWDHCRSFLHASKAYGPDQEGIVVKNQSKLGSQDNRAPAYIKIVNEAFKESHKVKAKRELSPEEVAAKERGTTLAASVVTEARVRKIILKLVDEGILPAELGPKDMGTVMKHLAKRVFDDVVKEERPIVEQIGEGAGKFISAEAAKRARKIVIGG